MIVLIPFPKSKASVTPYMSACGGREFQKKLSPLGDWNVK
jgi:hypothetical protein